MKNDIRRLVAYYVQKCDSRDPFQIAEYLNMKAILKGANEYIIK